MPSEREKMLTGALYDALDPGLVSARERAHDLCLALNATLCLALNATRDGDADARRRLLRELFAAGGDTAWLQPPFFCDFGANIELGSRVYFNFTCVVLDVCLVRIGDFRSSVRACAPDRAR